MPAETDPTIARARDGDREALEQLLAQNVDTLRSYLSRRIPKGLRATICADDLVQETLAEAFQKISHLRDASVPAFTAWLRTIGVMLLINQIEAANTQKRGAIFRRQVADTDQSAGSLVELLHQVATDSMTASRKAARNEGVAALRVAVAGLDEQQRRAIQLHLLQAYTLTETANEMGCTPDAVRGLVHRGKKRLAEAMGRASIWLSHG